MRYFAGLLLFAISVFSFAHDRTNDECTEAAEMVMHFAESRDSGAVDKAGATQQYDDSIKAVSGYPPEQRWFVQDDDDVGLLRAAILDVFDRASMSPVQLQTEFKTSCIGGKHSSRGYLRHVNVEPDLKQATLGYCEARARLTMTILKAMEDGTTMDHLNIQFEQAPPL
jgi:hypothetical protein